MVHVSVATSTGAALAAGPSANTYMNASPAVMERTALLKQCAEDRARVVCQYNADGFERILHLFNLTSTHPLLVHHLRNGFPMARNPLIPLPSFTFLPPNHLSASDTPEHKSFVIAYLNEEENLGHVSTAYPEEIVRTCYGNIRSSPLGVIDKTTPPGEPQKFRLITDGSHRGPDGYSINDFIDSDDFPTQWHGVENIAQLVSSSPTCPWLTPMPVARARCPLPLPVARAHCLLPVPVACARCLLPVPVPCCLLPVSSCLPPLY
jgi:hypothetical protein